LNHFWDLEIIVETLSLPVIALEDDDDDDDDDEEEEERLIFITSVYSHV